MGDGERPADGEIVRALLADYGLAPGTAREEPTFPLQRKHDVGPWCPHNQHVIDAHARRVTCGKCNAPLDPIDVLNKYAHDPAWIAEARQERRRIEAEVDALRKELSALKAAKRRIAPPRRPV